MGWAGEAKPKRAASAPPGPGADAGPGQDGDDSDKPMPKHIPRRKEKPGTFRQVDLDLCQTFGKLVPPKHRAAFQAHPSYKAALEQGLEPLEEANCDQEVHEPQLPIKTGMAALARALKRKEADVLEAEQALEGAKHWQEEAFKQVAAEEKRLATLREERRKCAEQYQQAALESSSEVLGGPLWECWQLLSGLP